MKYLIYIIPIITFIIFTVALKFSGLNIQEKISFIILVLAMGFIGSIADKIATIIMLDLICKDEDGNYKKTNECEVLKR